MNALRSVYRRSTLDAFFAILFPFSTGLAVSTTYKNYYWKKGLEAQLAQGHITIEPEELGPIFKEVNRMMKENGIAAPDFEQKVLGGKVGVKFNFRILGDKLEKNRGSEVSRGL